jgi:hypothetical protein
MSKSRKEILLELLELESDNLGDVGKLNSSESNKDETINAVETIPNEIKNDSITKPKKQLTEKQLEALKKGQQTRDENARRRKEEAMRIAEEEKKKLEAKIVRKAISIKKKEIKKQSALDEISDDDGTPIQKSREPTVPLRPLPLPVEKPKPKINFF